MNVDWLIIPYQTFKTKMNEWKKGKKKESEKNGRSNKTNALATLNIFAYFKMLLLLHTTIVNGHTFSYYWSGKEEEEIEVAREPVCSFPSKCEMDVLALYSR